MAVPRRLPTGSAWARLLVQYGPLVAPYLKRLYEQGRWRQLAIEHARTLVDGRFSDERIDGERHWVVWAGDHPVMAYPEVGADLPSALAHARADRRRDPASLPLRTLGRELAQRTDTAKRRLSGIRPARGTDDQKAADE